MLDNSRPGTFMDTKTGRFFLMVDTGYRGMKFFFLCCGEEDKRGVLEGDFGTLQLILYVKRNQTWGFILFLYFISFFKEDIFYTPDPMGFSLFFILSSHRVNLLVGIFLEELISV